MKTGLKLLALFLFTSCSTLHKESLLLKHSNTEESTLALSEKLGAKKAIFLNDSSISEMNVELIPKGKFSYSIKDGFMGEASHLTISKKETKRQQSTIKEELMQQIVQTFQQSKTVKEMVQVKAKERIAFNWFPLLLVMLGLVSAYLIWWKWKKLFTQG